MAKTAFHIHCGLFEWTVLPMGLANAPAMFMWAMSNLFTDLLGQGIIVFRDDVLVDSHTRGEHVQLLCMVFDKLRKHCFYCKLKKCSFFCTTTTFLSFNVTPNGMKISDAKVKSLRSWPLPTTMK